MEAAIGIALFIASLILVVGIVWLSEQTVGWRNYELFVRFKSAQGLKRGDAVNLAGIKIGRVERLVFRNGQAEAHIFLLNDQKLPRDSKFILGSGGLITGKVINIFPGDSDDYFVDGDVVDGELAGGLEELTPAITKLEARIHTSVDTLLSDANVDRMQATLRHVKATTAILEAMLEQNQKNFALTMANLRIGTEHLKKLFNDNGSQVDTAVANLTAATARLEAASRDLVATTASLKSASKALEDRQGTLGALLYERELYNNLTVATQNLNALIEDIKKHPQKYVKVSVF
jgi:phospholipid/cholesterol/gamma-HCH transport system substrate-binding protein